MATTAQIEANRRNSQKSTGPRTEAGKSASAQNATRSGLYAASLLIEGEDPEELDTLVREYFDSCRPADPREHAAVLSLIHTDRLLRRMRRVEAQDWGSQFAHLRKNYPERLENGHGLIGAYIRIQDRLDRIQRRVTTLERLYHRRLVDLERLQSRRPPAPEPPPRPAPVPAPDPEPAVDPIAVLPQIGFVPSNPSAPAARAGSPARRIAPAPGPHLRRPIPPPLQFPETKPTPGL
jgi:hypothetical protein